VNLQTFVIGVKGDEVVLPEGAWVSLRTVLIFLKKRGQDSA
jgi:hypothetical protein